MSKILFTYEFGGGFGHVNRLLEVAKRLDSRHELIFALPDLALGRKAVDGAFKKRVEVVNGVRWSTLPHPDLHKVYTHTFADAIRLYGYQEYDRLLVSCLRWMEILARFSPDLIVADWAPTLRLVSQPRIPTVIVGNGYTTPPKGMPLLPIRSWDSGATPAASRFHEAELLATVNRIRDQLSGPGVEFFSDLFHGEQTFVCTLREFDPYGSARVTDNTWPFNVPRPKAVPEGGPRNAVFCYLARSHSSLDAVLSALRGLDLRCEIFIRGADPQSIANRSSRKCVIHTQPADFAKALPESRILLHHAGLGTAYAGLVAGIPQLVIPTQLEHMVTARALNQFGCAKGYRPETTAPVLKAGLEEMLNNPKFPSSAMAAREALDARRTDDPVSQVAAACEAFI